jgi:hypothetical protein
MEHTECLIGMRTATAVFIIHTFHRFLTFVVAAPNRQERISWHKSDAKSSKMHGEVHFPGRPCITLTPYTRSLRQVYTQVSSLNLSRAQASSMRVLWIPRFLETFLGILTMGAPSQKLRYYPQALDRYIVLHHVFLCADFCQCASQQADLNDVLRSSSDHVQDYSSALLGEHIYSALSSVYPVPSAGAQVAQPCTVLIKVEGFMASPYIQRHGSFTM